jgi:RNA polymerase sigma-70 factor (ECF subfamily)
LENISDHQILSFIRTPSKKEEGFRLLLQRYQERLYWHIRRLVLEHEDANDVLQNVFIKVYRNLHQFKGDAKLFTWLYRIATNETLTFLNKKKKKQTISLEQQLYDLANTLEADTFFDGSEAQIKLQQAIFCLPEKQKMVFNMRYFEEMSYKEIAAILDTSVGGLKASYHHAVKKIEAYLRKN